MISIQKVLFALVCTTFHSYLLLGDQEQRRGADAACDLGAIVGENQLPIHVGHQVNFALGHFPTPCVTPRVNFAGCRVCWFGCGGARRATGSAAAAKRCCRKRCASSGSCSGWRCVECRRRSRTWSSPARRPGAQTSWPRGASAPPVSWRPTPSSSPCCPSGTKCKSKG